MDLFRAMTPAADGLPAVGQSARALGVRPPTDPTPDVLADPVSPGRGGLSVTPLDPRNLPPFRRPAILGGRGRDPVWVIATDDLGPDLAFRRDTATHGLIEPARPMTLVEYETALAATRPRWRLWNPGG